MQPSQWINEVQLIDTWGVGQHSVVGVQRNHGGTFAAHTLRDLGPLTFWPPKLAACVTRHVINPSSILRILFKSAGLGVWDESCSFYRDREFGGTRRRNGGLCIAPQNLRHITLNSMHLLYSGQFEENLFSSCSIIACKIAAETIVRVATPAAGPYDDLNVIAICETCL